MSNTNTSSRPKLVSGRYRILQTTDGDWFALDPENKRLRGGTPEDPIFYEAEEAADALIEEAKAEGVRYSRLYDPQSNVISEVVIGTPPEEVILRLALPSVVDTDLVKMAKTLNTTKGGALLKAIALLKIAMHARAEGKRVAILDDNDNSEQEITL